METTEDRVSSLHISSLVLFFVFLKRNIVQVNVLKCRWRQPCIQTTRKQKHGNHAAKNQRVLTLEVDGNIIEVSYWIIRGTISIIIIHALYTTKETIF